MIGDSHSLYFRVPAASQVRPGEGNKGCEWVLGPCTPHACAPPGCEVGLRPGGLRHPRP